MMFSLTAPAKINWFLSVLDRRDDGYHNIMSLMQCVDLFDTLTFEHAEHIAVDANLAIPVEDNLVYKAAVAIRRLSSYPRGASITLRKEIPSAAGLGGGSSDAAYTLLGLNRLWGLGLEKAILIELAASLGSDVPFFLEGNSALVEGRGERVSGLVLNTEVALLLVKPEIAVPTAWAYASYRAELTKKSIDIKLFCLALEKKDFAVLRQMVFNDLEQPVSSKYHEIGEIKAKLMQNGAALSSMSGSGSTVFGVFDSVEEAFRASVNMGDYWCRVVRTLS